MATQGIVTVLSNEKVVMKIITGSNGYNAQSLATELKNQWPVNIQEAYEVAISLHFGSSDSLVVMTMDSIEYRGIGEIKENYRDTFNQAEFNPRWECGTADYVVLLHV